MQELRQSSTPRDVSKVLILGALSRKQLIADGSMREQLIIIRVRLTVSTYSYRRDWASYPPYNSTLHKKDK
jgi:hypothetical protein